MDHIVYSTTGAIHLVFSIAAMIFGAAVLALTKGTVLHKRLGYAYSVSMLGCIVTSFMIYRLFNGWGIFHYMAVVSTVSLIGGMIPAILRKPKDGWLPLHYNFMYWSVVGLYAAFISEVMTRAPWADMRYFGIAMFIFFGIATWYARKLNVSMMKDELS